MGEWEQPSRPSQPRAARTSSVMSTMRASWLCDRQCSTSTPRSTDTVGLGALPTATTDLQRTRDGPAGDGPT